MSVKIRDGNPRTVPAPAASDGRSRRGDARRKQILRVAAELFLAQGYDGVSVDEIVRRAGGSKTNVYRQFGGKRELFIAVVEYLSTDVAEPLTTVDCTGLTLEQGLRTLARVFLTEVLLQERTIDLYRLVIGESARCPEVGHMWFARGPETTNQAFERFLATHASGGLIGRLQPRTAAVLFHDMLTFDFLQRVMLGVEDRPKANDVQQLIDRVVHVFLHGCFGSCSEEA